MGQEGFAGGVDGGEQALGEFVAAAMAETNERERDGGAEFEIGVGFDVALHDLSLLNRSAKKGDGALAPIGAHDVPEFERAEAAAELDAIVHEVDGLRVFGSGEVSGAERDAAAQDIGEARIEDAQIEADLQPLMRIQDDGMGALDAIEEMTEFRKDRGATTIGGVDMKPDAVTFSDIGDGGNRFDSGGAC